MNEMYEKYHRYVYWLVKYRFFYLRELYLCEDDANSVALYGFTHAMKTYDPSKMADPKHWIRLWVRRYLQKYLKHNCNIIKYMNWYRAKLDDDCKPINEHAYRTEFLCTTKSYDHTYIDETEVYKKQLPVNWHPIFQMMIEGYTQVEIAKKIGVSRQRVSQYIIRIRRKLNHVCD